MSVEVLVVGSDGTYLWHGHGVGANATEARNQALKRMPEGYAETRNEVTKPDVDERRISSEWVYPNAATRVVLEEDVKDAEVPQDRER